MNQWDCQHPGCKRQAIGTGGAIGLQAIGWWFERGQGGSGPRIYCPPHRPDGPQCAGGCGSLLPMMAADAEAVRWQRIMGSDIEPREPDLHTGYCAGCCLACSPPEKVDE